MNQKIADLFLSLPSALTSPAVAGSIALALCWLWYLLAARAPLPRRVREKCSPAVLKKQAPRLRDRVLYRPLRRRAALDEGGLYLSQTLLLLGLCAVTLLHPLLLVFAGMKIPAAAVADRTVVTLAVIGIGITALFTLPRAVRERHARWGFHPLHGVFFAALWEILSALAVLSWTYIAWFLPAIA